MKNGPGGTAKTRLTSLDVSRNCLGRQGAAALAAGLDEGHLGRGQRLGNASRFTRKTIEDLKTALRF